MKKPPLFPENIPASLKALPQWVCWRLMDVNGRTTKVPFAPKGGFKASSTNPEHWTSFEEAMAVYRQGNYSGIGFVLAESGQVGLDLDHCLADGKLHPDVEAILKRLNSYTEITQSGTGVHVLLMGKKNTSACARRENVWGGEIACYDNDRFFAMSGNLLPGYPTDLQPRQAELDQMCAEVWPTAPAKTSGNRVSTTEASQAGTSAAYDDDEILGLIRHSSAAAKFDALWAGDWNGSAARFMSQSEADSSLCWHLAFYTKDATQIDRMYRQSGLMRDKWDEPRPEGTYGSMTIQKALDGCTEQYRGGRKRNSRPRPVVLRADSNEASALFERSKQFVTELRASPDLKRLATAITDFLWQLPDLYLDVIKKDLADCLNGSFKVSSFNKAIHGERARRKQQATKAQAAEAHADAKAALRNHLIERTVNVQGDTVESIRAIPIGEIRDALLKHTGEWPRRVETLLFVENNGVVRYLEARDELFAWIQEELPLFWSPGQDSTGQSLTTKAEFISHLEATTLQYDAVEDLPHEPPMDGHYYAWQPPEDYTPTGEYFSRLLAYFDNAEAPEDRVLTKAALMTPAWGGMTGKRPAIVIMAPDRGCGKSTLANVIGHLYGGHIELNLTETAEDKLTSRLLTPGSMTKRVVRIDNIKNSYNSAFVEALITAPTISGHRMYHGDATRPNTLTFVMTGNALRLSRDIAERAFIIRLERPQYRADWESEVMNYVSEYRKFILADILHALRQPPVAYTLSDRYADWVQGVLARCDADVDAVVRLNQNRRDDHDDDQEEAGNIMEAIDADLAQKHQLRLMNIRQQGEDTWDVEPEEWFFISSTDMTEIVRKALNEPLSARAVNGKLSGHMEAGRMPRVIYKRTATCRGYKVRAHANVVGG